MTTEAAPSQFMGVRRVPVPSKMSCAVFSCAVREAAIGRPKPEAPAPVAPCVVVATPAHRAGPAAHEALLGPNRFVWWHLARHRGVCHGSGGARRGWRSSVSVTAPGLHAARVRAVAPRRAPRAHPRAAYGTAVRARSFSLLGSFRSPAAGGTVGPVCQPVLDGAGVVVVVHREVHEPWRDVLPAATATAETSHRGIERHAPPHSSMRSAQFSHSRPAMTAQPPPHCGHT